MEKRMDQQESKNIVPSAPNNYRKTEQFGVHTVLSLCACRGVE